MDIEKLFKRKNWRLFQEGDYIIRTVILHHCSKRSEEHVKKIIKVDIKNLCYIFKGIHIEPRWPLELKEDIVNMHSNGKIYFREANAFELAGTNLKALYKILVG